MGRALRAGLIAVVAVLASTPAADAQSASGTISTIAGSPDFDPGPLWDAEPTADGSVLVVEAFANRVRRVAPGGGVVLAAGNGEQGFGGDGGPATAASLWLPERIAVQDDGGYLIADASNGRIRRVAPDGTIATVAGNGTNDPGGNGGPATAAGLYDPMAVSATPDGGYLIMDVEHHAVRAVNPAGIISTVAGGCDGIPADGALAVDSCLPTLGNVVAAPGGSFYVLGGSFTPVVLRVTPDGRIHRVAGRWDCYPCSYSGDGGPATSAGMVDPLDVMPLSDGGFVIADPDDNRLRRVLPDGEITTLAGTGVAGNTGDGGPATGAELDMPTGIGPAPGGLYVTSNGALRFVQLVGVSAAPAVGPLALPTAAAPNPAAARPVSVRLQRHRVGRRYRLGTLTVQAPPRTRVSASCRGAGCWHRALRRRVGAGGRTVIRACAGRRLARSARVTVTLSIPGRPTLTRRFRMRSS